MTRRVAALLLAVLLLLGMTLSASAATYEAGDNIRVYHDFALAFKLKERNAEGFPWMATGYLVVSGNTLVLPSGASWVYCIDYWHSASGGTYTSTDLMQTPAWTSLSFVARKGITHAMIYGCPNNGRADIYSYAATQLIIWEYQLGQRTNASQTVSYFNSTLSQNSTLRSIYDSILASMAAHDILPSFDGQSVTLNGYGRENGVTLTDTNGKLMNDAWTVSVGAGFHAEQTGNSLLIYADSSVTPGSTTNITLKRSLNVVTGTALGIAVGQQKAIIGVPPDPVAAALSVTLNNMGELTIQKTSDSGDVSDYCFKVYKHTDNLSWYGKSDSSGNVYVTNSNYTASGTKVYTFTGMTDGTYSFLEVLSQKGKDLVFPDSWRITVVKDGSTKFDHTYTGSNLSKDSNGDCRLASIAITGLTGGGTMTMTIHNAPETGDLEIVKTSSDGHVSGISFKVEKYEATGGIGWWEMGTYTTNASGTISIPGLTVGTELRVTEIVPDGYICRTDNPQTIRIAAGQNRLNFENEPVPKLEIVKTCSDGNISNISFKVERQTKSGWTELGTYTTDDQGKITVPNLAKGQVIRVTEIVPDGYVCNSENPQTITLVPGTNRLTFENEPLPKLEIIKTCSDGNVENISFRVERFFSIGGTGWTNIGTYKTDANGKITIEGMNVGAKLRVTEIVPSGYVCNSENPQTITLVAGLNRLNFENEPVSTLEIVKVCSDGNISGISFTVEEYEPEGGIGWWEKGTYTTDADGKITIEGLRVGTRLRVTENVPEGYVCNSDNPQEITLTAGTNTLTFENEPLADVEIIKTSSDGQVSGISFLVEKYVGRRWRVFGTYETDSDGKINIPNLSVGSRLRITENVPENYVCLSENPQEITLVGGTNTVSFENKPIIRLELLKTSDDGKVDGIEFTLSILRGRRYVDIGTYTTHDGGQISVEDLTLGATYRLTETVPEGYIGVEPVQTFVAAMGTNTVTFENRLIRGSLRIVKKDKGTEIPLQGAGYRVYSSAGKLIAEGYTDENGELVFENLRYGSYYYQEFEAPEGFVLDETCYDFSITQDGVEVSKLQFNDVKEGSIRISKTNEQGRPLSGVTFLLEFSVNGGETWSPVAHRDESEPVRPGYCTSNGLDAGKLTTSIRGQALFTGLCIDTQLGEVLYRVTEVSTVSGYSLLADYAFEGSLSEDEEIDVSFTVVNQPEFQLPATGGEGFTSMIIGLIVVLVVGVIAVIIIRVKEKKDDDDR